MVTTIADPLVQPYRRAHPMPITEPCPLPIPEPYLRALNPEPYLPALSPISIAELYHRAGCTNAHHVAARGALLDASKWKACHRTGEPTPLFIVVFSIVRHPSRVIACRCLPPSLIRSPYAIT
ncbi:hypothetical protein CALVIDRAFT_157247 [Calocera viscosa TUFC12733]|uniref:Uncharacterized protein n=1 Tax=Calocera viscosa (strain TUFC12733) TaxID=1330018 RepID=A0A167LAV7_CALVF|nr:hypothetical protein CALVIDRAFT_157247 [Calocera viscosa TUFC12733]